MNAQRKLNTWLPLLFAIVMIAGMTIGYKLRENTTSPGGFFAKEQKTTIQQIFDLINIKYVDKVNTDTLLSGDAIQQMLARLDPHTLYIPAVSLGDINDDLQGNFQGIGVEFNIFDDTVHVVTVLEGGPSDKAGLQVGDRFLKVGDTAVAGNGITAAHIRQLLRGPGGSIVRITLLRGNKPLVISIQRGTIPLVSVDAAYMSDPQTGFIHISKFSETTYEEFMQALEKLQKQGLQKLVLDLRDNGGGIMQDAIEIADEFLDGTKLIVYTEGNNSPRQEYRCKRDGIFEKGKLVVLVDEGTASASEVLVGALQDWDRAEIVGRRTFGKGLVQEQFTLTDGSALRLVTARYYTPSGRSIQKPYKEGEDYSNDIVNRYQHGEMVNADSNHISRGKAYKTHNGRTVYGGGAIMPDVFVSADTSSIPHAFARLYTSNTMSDFAYRYFISHRGEFAAGNSPLHLYQEYKDSKPLWSSFSSFAAKDSIDISAVTGKNREQAQQRLVALIARQQWKSNGFYEVMNADDSTVIRGLQEVNK
ncbi:MAG: S41 family peptidase [Bacteroidetes bacterium]|nr:S41 family peptidase [Bacteroidota bacterium]